MAAMRWGDSKKISVAGAVASSARRSRRALSFEGRKPARKVSLERPEPTKAASGAEGPGIGMTRWPASMAAWPRR